MSEPMPTIPTQSPFTYPNPNSSASPSFTQDDTFMPEPIQPMPTFTQTAFSQPAVHTQHTHPAQTNPTGQQYPNNVQSQQFQQFQTATISANNAKFPYLEKEKYEIWAMKMEYWIQNADHNLWRIVQQGNSPKRLGKDAKGNTIVHPPVSLDEHVAVQRENKVRTLLLQALPEDHMPDFHHYDDARDIWMAVKARFGGNEESKKMKKTMLKQQFAEFSVTEEEGLHKGYDRFQKILSQLNQVQARPDNDDINLKFLRALPSSWSQVALALKTRGGLESMSFDDLYNKLRSLELDVRIGHSYGVKVAAAPTHSAFIGTACSGSKPTYSDQQRIVPSVSQTSGRSDNVMECVLHSFVAENEQDQDMIYEDFDQVDQLEMEEMDLKWQMAMLSLRINRFEKKAGRKMNYNNQQPARFDRRKVTEVKTDEPKALVSPYDSMGDASDAAAEFAMMGISPKAYQHAVKTLESQKDWYHKTQIALEEKIRVLSANLENTTNTLSYTEKLHDQAQKEKKEWEVKFEATLARFEKWKESSKNLKNLIDSSMIYKNYVGLDFNDIIDQFSAGTMGTAVKNSEVTLGGITRPQFWGVQEEMVDIVNPHGVDPSTDNEHRLANPYRRLHCCVAKASLDDIHQMAQKMVIVNFKTINKLAKEGSGLIGFPLMDAVCHAMVICYHKPKAEILCQAEAEIRKPKSSEDSILLGSNPADCFPPAGSVEPADESNPAVSSSVSADFHPVYADESTLPPGQQLGSSENFYTIFPVPPSVSCMDKFSSGIFNLPRMMMICVLLLPNFAPAVEVIQFYNGVNIIHPQFSDYLVILRLLNLDSTKRLCSCLGLKHHGKNRFLMFYGQGLSSSGLHCFEGCFITGSQFHPAYWRMLWVAGSIISEFRDGLRKSYAVSCLALGVNTPGSDENRLQLFDLMYILVNGAVAAKSGSCCLRDVAASFDSAVHRVHAVSFDAAVASIVSATLYTAAAYFVPAALQSSFVPADSLNSIPADYVSAGHVLVPADSDRIC
ncbi:hypothetical protein Tco_1549631 [Tanacetum coccineum]